MRLYSELRSRDWGYAMPSSPTSRARSVGSVRPVAKLLVGIYLSFDRVAAVMGAQTRQLRGAIVARFQSLARLWVGNMQGRRTLRTTSRLLHHSLGTRTGPSQHPLLSSREANSAVAVWSGRLLV